jgi:predicted Rossmann fold nucleotide-binding protein DprA/Smf involved in DNA uptake
MLGNPGILEHKTLALFCSVRCPGSLILQTFDLVRDSLNAGVAVIGGFQSPMEKECLSLLLKGKRPVIWCQAKCLPNKQRPKIFAGPLTAGRLLIISLFDDLRRATEKSALIRNEFVAALADTIFVSYANPGGMLEKLCRKVLEWKKTLFTFESVYNAGLISMGARPYGDFVSIKKLSS